MSSKKLKINSSVGSAKVGGLSTYLSVNHSVNSNTVYASANTEFDFELVKINCKKELDIKELNEMPPQCNWTYRKVFGILFGLLFIIGVFFVTQLFISQAIYPKDNKVKRSVDIYSQNRLMEWSNENLPSVYEIDIHELIGGDLSVNKRIQNELKYIKNQLKINCIQVKNVEDFFDLTYLDFLEGKFEINSQISEQRMNRQEKIRFLIESTHAMSMRVSNYTYYSKIYVLSR